MLVTSFLSPLGLQEGDKEVAVDLIETPFSKFGPEIDSRVGPGKRVERLRSYLLFSFCQFP